MKRLHKAILPTTDNIAETAVADGFTLTQRDHAGIENTSASACTYDHLGRRATKKVTVDGSVALHQRYLYRGYLQIDSQAPHCLFAPSGQTRFAVCPPDLTAVGRVAASDLRRSGEPCLWHITWDPTQETATRPLSIRKDGTWYCYGWDITKNVCEVFKTNGGIGTTYAYTPYGLATTSGSISQPLQWSSEFADTETDLTYYNYRHYNPIDGRWLGRDFAEDTYNLYMYNKNNPTDGNDILGLMYKLKKVSKINWVPKSSLGTSIGRFVMPNISAPNISSRLCFCTISFPNNDISGKIEQAKEEEVYEALMKYDKSKNRKFISKHERKHAEDYYSEMTIFINEMKVYEGCNCMMKEKCNKVRNFIDASREYHRAKCSWEATKLDVKDYVGSAKDDAQRKLPQVTQDYRKAKTEYEKQSKLSKNSTIDEKIPKRHYLNPTLMNHINFLT